MSVGKVSSSPFGLSQTKEGYWETTTRSPSATHHLGIAIGQQLKGGEVITLTGDLGSGKTCLVRGLAQGMGLSPDEVSSPTFTLIQEYDHHPPIVHVDLYRLDAPVDIDEIGLSTYFDGDYVVIVEWADRTSVRQLPNDRLMLHLSHRNRNSRQVKIQAFGQRSQAVLNALIH